MNLLDAVIKEQLEKKGKINKEQEEREALVPEHLKISWEMKYRYAHWNLMDNLLCGVLKHIGEKEGNWDLASKALAEVFTKFCFDYVRSETVAPLMNFLKSMAGTGKSDLEVYAQAITMYDYIAQNIDTFEEITPNKYLGTNVFCDFWEPLKNLNINGLDKLNCAPTCFGGCKAVAAAINPKLKMVGPRDGKEIGVPEVGFVKNRLVGDDVCSFYIVLEE